MAPGRRPIAGYKHPMVYPTDHGQTTAVTKSSSGEIALRQSELILQEISDRLGDSCDHRHLVNRLIDAVCIQAYIKPVIDDEPELRLVITDHASVDHPAST
jgi:hypothetical protein